MTTNLERDENEAVEELVDALSKIAEVADRMEAFGERARDLIRRLRQVEDLSTAQRGVRYQVVADETLELVSDVGEALNEVFDEDVIRLRRG